MNNDLISREDLKKAIEEYRSLNCVSTSTIIGVRNVFYLIDNAPTVEPTFGLFKDMLCAECDKRPQGEWILVDDTEKFIAKCSVCGRIEDSRMVKDYPFCHCGADMRGEKNETDN